MVKLNWCIFIFLFHFVFISFSVAAIEYHPADKNQDGIVNWDNGELMSFMKEQLTATLAEIPAQRYPRRTTSVSDGSWFYLTPTSWSGWTNGFFPGALWYMYENTNNSEWQTLAESFTTPLAQNSGNAAFVHDLGFMIYHSFGNGYRLTNNIDYKQTLSDAAVTVASTYNSTIQALSSGTFRQVPGYRSIIDAMSCLKLLFWAVDNEVDCGAVSCYDIAVGHSTKSAQNLVRKDGSVYQEVFYNSDGSVSSYATWQGYATESTWSRGQAWAMYGFTNVYENTKDAYFLRIAKKVSDYFFNNLPADSIPYWDFEYPDLPTERDTSAAAIAASALVKLSKLIDDPYKSAKYYDTAVKIINSLSSVNYLAKSPGTVDTNAFLLHGSETNNKSISGDNRGDLGLIYGDYFFIEAVTGLLNMNSSISGDDDDDDDY